MNRTVLLCALCLCGAGCRTTEPPADSPAPLAARSKQADTGAFANTDPWLLMTTDPNANRGNHGIFLGNGLVGATFGPNGGASKESVCFVAGAYDKAENLQPFPLWHDLGLPDPKPGDKYEQTLDMKHGVLTTKIAGVTVTALASITSAYHFVVHVEGAPKPANAPASQTIGDVTVSITDQTDGAGWTRIATFLPPGAPRRQVAPADWQSWLQTQEQAWVERWGRADIQIEGDPEAQQLVHKLMFDLLQSARENGTDSIAPEALSGSFYKGHIFWDAEVWMFPSLLAQYPELARTMLEYRFRHLGEARAQAQAQNCVGADFPWESAASGREVAPGGFKQGRHVTAGVGWAAWQYYLATGDKVWLRKRGWPLLNGVAEYFASRAKKNAQGKYDITNVYGPDELKGAVNNNTYTNALARYDLNAATQAAKLVGQAANPRWAEVASGLVLPFDKTWGVYLARDDDDGKSTKQADGELVLYPAALPMDSKIAQATFAFQSARPIKNGPAMTDSVHALLAARLGQAKTAEDDFREAYRPFVRGPFLLFSEKRSLDRCVFTTGAGGTLQAVLYGFGGLDYSSPTGLVSGPVALPPTWKKLTITGIQRSSKRYTLTVTPQGRKLTEQR